MKKFILLLIVPFLSFGQNDTILVEDTWDSLNREGEPGNTFYYYKGKLINGMVYSVYENGQLEEEYNFKEGYLHGAHRQWFENGQLKKTQTFKYSPKIKNRYGGLACTPCEDGVELFWYEDGQKREERVIKNGEHGNVKAWYQNGELSYERQGCLWSEQQKTFIQNGFTKTWHENGQLKSVRYYENDTLTSKQCFTSNASKIKCEW